MKNFTLSFAFLFFAAMLGAQTPTLTINAGAARAQASPILYGLMTEEINYSYDGGLYAELVANRVVLSGWDAQNHWSTVEAGSSAVAFDVDEKSGPSAAIHTSMRLTIKGASSASPAGVQNDGYWGIALQPQTSYSGSLYAKSAKPGITLIARLVNDHTGATVAEAKIPNVGGDWAEHKFTLKTGAIESSTQNHLQILATEPTTLWLNLVSLFPPTYKNRAHGNRADIMQLLAAMNPHFLRLPGGNYLEGNKLEERFDWTQTLGPLVDRPTHKGPWGYQSSDGMGLLEYLQWCEDLQIEPVLAVFAGYTLDSKHVDPGVALEPYVNDALDEIEYVTGNATTKWGARRAADGHPAPFRLRFVEVGNEDQFDPAKTYEARFAQFAKAIRAKYPNLQLIATMPIKETHADLIDDHYYLSADEMFASVHKYDDADRNGAKIFVGEWATREGTPTPNHHAALADAAWLTGLERNSDVVVMEAYAPLFVNVNPGGMQWATNLIGYDAASSYGSPSYWVQAIFSTHYGNEILDAKLTDTLQRVFASATRDTKQRLIFVKVVNANSTPLKMQIDITGLQHLASTAKLITLAAPSANATNTISQPNTITPEVTRVPLAGVNFTQIFAPNSINVLTLTDAQ